METADPVRLHFEGLTLDLAARTLVDGSGREVTLRRSEYELLRAFVDNPGRALSRDLLLDAVAGRRSEPYDRSIDVLVGRLRRKIEPEPIRPRLIITVPGIGYRFAAKPSPMPQQAAMGDPVPPSISLASGPNKTGAHRRKLVAVVYADMVGYSRLIGLDDQGTFSRLGALRREVIDPAIEKHGGKIVQTGGDSLLAVFGSLDGAVRCAMWVQEQVPMHDGDQPQERAIRFRVGINIGDTIQDETDLHGDAVNIAVRLQAECPPGGICVSRAVRDHVHGRDDLDFEGLGQLNLENIGRPVEAFLLRFRNAATAKFVEQARTLSAPEDTKQVDKPSIAVLPFTNLSGIPEEEYFSDGVAGDIIAELSRSRSLLVMARSSSFSYKGSIVDAKRVAQELGVRYVVEGSVRRSQGRVRISVQLIDGKTGSHIWAERYDRDYKELFALQDEITLAVSGAILPAVADADLRHVLRKPPEHLGAWEAYQRGRWHFAKYDAANNERAIDFFLRAISLDDTLLYAYINLTIAYRASVVTFAVRPLADAMMLAEISARKAAEIDPQDAYVQVVLGIVAAFSGRHEEATECASLALAMNPHLADAIILKGSLLIRDGRTVDGRNALLVASRLDSNSPRKNALRLVLIAFSYYIERDYAGAADVARKAIARCPIERYPGNVHAFIWLAAALGQLGLIEEARAALHTALTAAPEIFNVHFLKRPPWRRLEHHEHILDGLRKAGWEDSGRDRC